MRKTNYIVLNTFHPLESEDLMDIYSVFSKYRYNDDDGFGFVNSDICDNCLNSRLIRKVRTVVNQFDATGIGLERRSIDIITQVEFSIDSKFKVIEIFNSSSEIQKVRSTFKLLFDNKYLLDNIVFQPYKVLQDIYSSSEFVRINKIKIENFKFSEYIIGSLSANTTNNQHTMDLLSNYKGDVKKVNFTVKVSGRVEMDITISDLGLITLNCEESEFQIGRDYIKSIITL